MIDDYAITGIFLLIGIGFVLVTFFIARLLRPHRPSPVKLESYECGEHIMGSSWIQYNVGYYIFALIFVIFDVEVIFLFPWAVAFKKLGLFALIEMFIFLAILIFALIYAWRKGALRWV
ncbi:MAG: NADH-quinone oxidoreductase subunit A [Candidatus Zixiibacteriota bacterium]|nr:MAG: NADH-quinone oxidoreductase subunit A [candidate division Zixibacteria bacterium]